MTAPKLPEPVAYFSAGGGMWRCHRHLEIGKGDTPLVTLDAAKEYAALCVQQALARSASDDAIGEAVRAYVQAGKRGCDLLGAMREAVKAAATEGAAAIAKGETE